MHPRHLLFIIPIVILLPTIFWTNRVDPWVFGLPFFQFWVYLWGLLGMLGMVIYYFLDPANKTSEDEEILAPGEETRP